MAPPNDPQEPAPHGTGESHPKAGEFAQPIVIGPLDVLSLGIAAGLDVIDELVWGGPIVLGRHRE